MEGNEGGRGGGEGLETSQCERGRVEGWIKAALGVWREMEACTTAP